MAMDGEEYGDEDVPKAIRECLDILDENIEFISGIEDQLEDEKEDEVTPGMGLHNLYDMTEDVAESAKIRRAEANFARRQAEEPSG